LHCGLGHDGIGGVRLVWALLVAGFSAATFQTTSAHAGDVMNEKEAREHFRAGVHYLQDIEGERYEEAYAEFKAAYALSKSPKVLGNIALCAMKLERDGEAIELYTRYLREVSDIATDERAQIERDLETLKASAAPVSITTEAMRSPYGNPASASWSCRSRHRR